jgi:hypothetical protein
MALKADISGQSALNLIYSHKTLSSSTPLPCHCKLRPAPYQLAVTTQSASASLPYCYRRIGWQSQAQEQTPRPGRFLPRSSLCPHINNPTATTHEQFIATDRLSSTIRPALPKLRAACCIPFPPLRASLHNELSRPGPTCSYDCPQLPSRERLRRMWPSVFG